MKKAIFIAATGQNVGKTTICLGLLAALKKRFKSVGFIKPVGQQHVEVEPGVRVDKDVVLFHDVFGLKSAWRSMSPVIVPAGFTRAYLDGEVAVDHLKNGIKESFAAISGEHEFTVVEGTGHTGVGSIIDLNNAEVAKELNLPVVLIATGGLGSAFDELSLNIELCLSKGLEVSGIILNRVLDEKREMIETYFKKALRRYGVPLIGCIPYNEFLNTPSIGDFAQLFGAELLSAKDQSMRHFSKKRLVASSLAVYSAEVEPKELVITPACRTDIITVLLDHHDKEDIGGGLILTGRHPPEPEVLERLKKSCVPAFYAPVCSYDAMRMITQFTAKIRTEDTDKVQRAIELVEGHLYLDIITHLEPAVKP